MRRQQYNISWYIMLKFIAITLVANFVSQWRIWPQIFKHRDTELYSNSKEWSITVESMYMPPWSSVVLLDMNRAGGTWTDKLPILSPSIVVHQTRRPVHITRQILSQNQLFAKNCRGKSIQIWVNYEYTLLTCNFTVVIVLTLYKPVRPQATI